MSDAGERIDWMDGLRVAACLAVVGLHVGLPLRDLPPALEPVAWWTGVIMTALSAWCVPVFIMISGALLLARPWHLDPGGFYRRRRDFMVQVMFWSCLYMAIRLGSNPPPTFGDLMVSLWKGQPYYHLWFLFMLGGLYVVTPLYCRWVRSVSRQTRILTIAGILLVASLVTWLRDRYAVGWHQNVFTLFIPFSAYYLAGFELRHAAGNRYRWIPPVLFVVALGGLIGGAGLVAAGSLSRVPLSWLFGAFSPFIVALSLGAFMLGRMIRLDSTGRRAMTVLSSATLGIYLLHPLLLRFILAAGWLPVWMPVYVLAPLLVIVVFAWSAVTVLALGRIAQVRRLVGIRAETPPAGH